MSRLIDENTIIKMLNTMDRYTSEELTLCDTDETFPKNEVFIVDDVFEGLDELPSAQPEPSWDCEKCIMEHTDEMEKLEAELAIAKSKHPEPCEDAVSRQEVADILENADPDLYVDLFNKLPPVTPKQRTGKWIKLDMHRGMADHKCSACEQECYVPTCMGEPMYAFCPNCGARMEVTT